MIGKCKKGSMTIGSPAKRMAAAVMIQREMMKANIWADRTIGSDPSHTDPAESRSGGGEISVGIREVRSYYRRQRG